MTDIDHERGRQLLATCADPWPVERMALVVFTPGCLVAGRLGHGLELLERAGFRPVFGRLIHFTQPLVRRIWRYQLRTFRPDRWRLIVDLLLAGPSFLTIWVDERPGEVCGAQRMTLLKGPSDPRLGEPGQLRTELGGMNKVINLVHSAQEADDVVRETAILLDEAEFRAAWSRSAPATAGQARVWWPSAAPVTRPAGVSFAHTAAALRRRIVEALAWRLGAAFPAALLDLLREETLLLDALRPDRPLVALATFRERFGDHRATKLLDPLPGPESDPLPGPESGPEPDPDQVVALLTDGLAELEGALFDDRCDLTRLWGVLDQAGLETDRWERLIISTQQVTADLAARK